MSKNYTRILTIAVAMMAITPCFGRNATVASRTDALSHSALSFKMRATNGAAQQAPIAGGMAMKAPGTHKSTKVISVTGDMITEAPAGEVHASQVRSSMSFDVQFNTAFVDKVDAMVGEFVVADDGYIYIKNPFAFDQTNTYMKARLEGDEAVLTLPQLIDRDDIYGTGQEQDLFVARVKYELDEEGQGWYNFDEQTQEIRFEYKNGVLSQIDEKDIMYGLVTEDGEWLGFGDYNLVMKPVGATVTKIPEANVEKKVYTLSHTLGAELIEVAFDGDDVYVTGLNPDMPQACIVGKKDGDKVTFPAVQYLGTYNLRVDQYEEIYHQYHVYFMPAVITSQWNDDYKEYMDVYDVTDEIVFNIDSQTGVMSTNDVMLANASKIMTYYIKAFEEPRLLPYPGIRPAVPATPIVTEFLEVKDWYGDGDYYGAISFIMMAKDADGNYIDTDKLYYNIFVNDELFTFTPDEFINLTEDMTDVPFNFKDDYDIQISDIFHNVYFTNTEYTKIGVRAKYVVDGVENVSPIAYAKGVGISEPDMEEEPEAVVYTDLLGNRVKSPSTGLYIKTMTYSDGSRKSVKTFIK